MRRSKTAAAAALLTLLALLPLAVAPVAAGDRQAKAKAEHQRIVNYWTAERIASAKPRDFVKTADGQFEPKARPSPGRRRHRHRRLVDPGRPRRQAHRQGPVHDGRRQLGLLGARSSTTAARPHSIVLTAGHCAYDEVNQRPRHQLDLRPLVRYLADLHLRPDDVRLLDRARPRRPQRLRQRWRLQHPGHRPRLRVRDRRAAGTRRAPSSTPLRRRTPIAYPAISTGRPGPRVRLPGPGSIQRQGPDLLHRPDFNDPTTATPPGASPAT